MANRVGVMSPADVKPRLVDLGGGVRIAITDEGEGPAVVMLHGWPVTSFHWRLTVPALVEQGLRAVCMDLRGLGGSSGGPPYTKEVLANDIVGVLDQLGVEAFGLVGHDWASKYATVPPSDHRDRVRALVSEEELVFGNASLVEPGKSHYPRWHGPFIQQVGLADAMIPGREDVFYGTWLRQSAGPLGLQAEAERIYVNAYRPAPALTAGLGYYRCSEEDDRALRVRATTALEIPVMSVGGELATGTAVGEDLRHVAPRLQHVQIARAGHYPAEQQAEAFNSAVTGFLLSQL